MRHFGTRQIFISALVVALALAAVCAHADAPGRGALTVIAPDGSESGACPLEHTSVNAEISGFTAHVEVKQIFRNPLKEKIEAVYTFPLSADGAVNSMVMRIGDRIIRGEIKEREEARRIYDRARRRGQTASLLDQERPNIFTQSVANIAPGAKVEVIITYVEILPYADGAFAFTFPMVVGPRFIPGEPVGRKGTGWAQDTPDVPDASRITPPVTPEGTRAGHDIDLTVSVDAGVPIGAISSKLHEITTSRRGKNAFTAALTNKNEIPNRDFVLRYDVAGDDLQSGVLAHKDGDEGYAAVVMIPPKRVEPDEIAPREMIFVIDCSGSQRGKPLEKAKETMKYVIERLNPNDTFNVVDFNAGARMLFSEPKKNTPEYRRKALEYIEFLRAQGGTWMGPAIETICKTRPPENRLRIVTFMTDGYVGNDFEIISLVERLRGKSRWFPFGTGNSVNRFLLDNMARAGGGEVEYILLNSPGKDTAERFYKRIDRPVLTDITVEVDGVSLEDVYPKAVSDLWSRRPLVFKGRYTQAGKGVITIKGYRAGKPYEQTLHVDLPEKRAENRSVQALWARSKVDNLTVQDWMGIQRGNPNPSIKKAIIDVALKHALMTQFTSFVAVEEKEVTVGGEPIKVTVPVEMPDSVSREGVFGEQKIRVAKPGRHASRALAPGRLASRPSFYGAGYAQSYGARRGAAPTAPQPAAAMERRKGRSWDRADSPGKIRYEEADAGRSRSAPVEKLAPKLRTLLASDKQSLTSASVGLHVIDGRVAVKVRVEEINEKTLDALKRAGLKVEHSGPDSLWVIGTIEVDALRRLAELSEVISVEPIEKKV